MLVYFVLIVLSLAIVGAVLNPMAHVLQLLPEDITSLLNLLNRVKLFIADFLLWLILLVGLLMLAAISRQRLARYSSSLFDKEGARINPHIRCDPLRIAVAIVAYNEEESIAGVVQDFRSQVGVVEVIVVDNNSLDRTADLAKAAGAKVVREDRQGYGYACIRGLQEALAVSEADLVVLTEGDGTFSAEDLAKFQAYMRHADMVVGTRTVPGLVEKGSQMDYFFTWGNMFVAALLRLKFWEPQFLGKARITDVGCTYRAIHREALERILPYLHVGGDHFSPHMMLVALSHGLSLIEIPITFRKRIGRSKGASQGFWKGLSVGLLMIWHIMTYWPRPHEMLSAKTVESLQSRYK